MPVVISMLNSYSGWATSAAGLMLSNMVMVVTGALVGSSGAILSYIMCRAMNRSFISVILGGFGEGVNVVPQQDIEGEMKEISGKDAAQMFANSKSIVIIPGYGMAAGKAQHAVASITKLLRKNNINLRFAVHPVAGRLPGHMNVLLAEARVPYDIVLEMDEINDDFPKTDLALVLGANDIVNPSALDDPNSPIAGMPVIECWKAKHTIIIKRGKGAGYAGVENPLFFLDNSRMLYGNALTVCEKLLADLSATFGEGGAAAPKPDEKTPLKAEEKPGYQTKDVFPEVSHYVGVPKEVEDDECRVAATPDSVIWMRKMGFGVFIEKDAGVRSRFSDEDYIKAGATICPTPQELYQNAEIVLKVRPPTIHPKLRVHECTLMRKETVVLSYLYPARNPETLKEMEKAGITCIAMDQVPRISRAQKCDTLSSMAGISGYRAVIEAANYFPRYMTGQMTAAGTVKPAKVLVVGAGVAGLAAIGAAKGLGAIVRAFDSRSAVREQIESMGGEFLTIDIEEEGETTGGYSKTMSDEYVKMEIDLFKQQAQEVDIIITTAQIPNRKAPILIPTETVMCMRSGSVIVDLAAETGGNCELTKPGFVVDVNNGVKVVGETNFVSKMATQSSTLFANNLCHLLDEMGKAANFAVDEKNEIIYGSLCVIQGKIRWDPNRKPMSVTAAPKPAGEKPASKPSGEKPADKPAESIKAAPVNLYAKDRRDWFFYFKWVAFVTLIVGIMVLSLFMDYNTLNLIVVFTLSIYIGFMVIWNVTPALHTPLMSVTNAVSGIIICGGIVELTAPFLGVCFCLGAVSVFLAAINCFGGFIVTHRMLQMFVIEKKMK
jgi:NAD(P) transhydrogenase